MLFNISIDSIQILRYTNLNLLASIVFSRYYISMDPFSEIAVLIERLARIVQNDSFVDDLKPTQWEALRYLSKANRFSCNPTALTAYLGVTKGTVSQTINALERKGLLKKKAIASDKRLVNLSLTARANNLLKNDPLSEITIAASKMSVAQQTDLKMGLKNLLVQTLDERQRKPFGACKTCTYFQKNSTDGSPHRCQLLEVPLSEDDSEKICFEQKLA